MSFGSPNNPYGQPQDPQQGHGQPQQPGYPQTPQGVPPQQGYGYPQQPGYPQAPQGVPPQQGYGYPQQPGYPGYPQQGGYPGGGTGMPALASMGRRLGARLIDGVIIGVIYLVFAIAGVAGVVNDVKDCDPNAVDYQTCVNDASTGAMAKIWGVVAIVAIASLLYEWLMVGLLGKTLGKMAVGIRVVKAETGAVPGLGAGILRWLVPWGAGLLCCLGSILVYCSPFWDKSGRQQGWHDKAAGTMVVQN